MNFIPGSTVTLDALACYIVYLMMSLFVQYILCYFNLIVCLRLFKGTSQLKNIFNYVPMLSKKKRKFFLVITFFFKILLVKKLRN